ncbi:metaphase-anaphase transition protein (Mlo2), putative [Rhizoctonia solani AG-3 Rhs1AP]|uniref:Metaphase-anaphase transition protein (Mlo2), putative n=2 Tax=Rhizoctonia solani AG-3 TaxID=1086053 RepID=A0A0A1UJP4_9AGAM|nr:metaphase-anaphase transition protein (Mlo2), putative [Rhizoctonia solani AG-3 Rhs1AP]KEP52540.1 putative metaphase-anaphase transition protein (mlo2) [Rhizoctonia solani 123E]
MTTPQALALAQASLVHEASIALPGEFSQCTYDLGYLKQSVYLCLMCEAGRGVCASCSISCHADHEQIELFPKRHFRCDCPTSGMAHPCALRPPVPPNTDNVYSQNYFDGGRFCRCAQTYDAKRERETMVQCVSCEDWFHESCLNLRERVPPRDPDAPPPTTESDPAADSVEADDASSVSSSTSLPPALLPGDTYETLVCGTCVRKIPTLKRYAGTKGVRMVVPSQDGFKIIGEDWEEQVNVDGEEEEGKGAGTKRRASGTGEDEQASKRPRADESIPASTSSTTIPNRCTAPPINAQAQTILADPTAYGDVFLSEGWRERWCRCETCYPSILKHPFLLEEEEIYEPPQDPDAGLSLEELGMRALATLPHERALDSIRAYNAMRDDLMLYLRPFADSGREVREEDITAFFQRRRQG